MTRGAGTGRLQQQVVRATLGSLARTDVGELSARTGLCPTVVDAVLRGLAQNGEAIHSGDGRWEAAVPDLPTSEHWVAEFRQRLAESPRSLEELPGVETYFGARAGLEIHYDLWANVKSHAVLLDRPPYLGGLPMPSDDEPDNPEFAAVHRGVTVQAVYSTGFRQLARLWYLREAVESQAGPLRIGPVPLKLCILDDRTAFMPSLRSYEVPGHMAAVVITDPPLIQMLREVFEATWDFARPLPVALATETADRRAELVALLLAGLTDAAIGHELDVSERTVRRWVHDLLVVFGCETRLQLGAALARGHDPHDPLNPTAD